MDDLALPPACSVEGQETSGSFERRSAVCGRFQEGDASLNIRHFKQGAQGFKQTEIQPAATLVCVWLRTTPSDVSREIRGCTARVCTVSANLGLVLHRHLNDSACMVCLASSSLIISHKRLLQLVHARIILVSANVSLICTAVAPKLLLCFCVWR